jgi:hypothetical protein
MPSLRTWRTVTTALLLVVLATTATAATLRARTPPVSRQYRPGWRRSCPATGAGGTAPADGTGLALSLTAAGLALMVGGAIAVRRRRHGGAG